MYRSPADGHCLLHSIVSSLKAQYRQTYGDLTIDHLCDIIRDQIRYNENLYLPFIKNAYHATRVKGMEDYLNLKRYNTRFGDLVPLIIANGLGINIIILGSHQSKILDIVYGKRHGNSGLKNHVFIYKSGEHYDAIIPTNRVFVKNNDPFVSNSDTDNSVCSDIKFLVWNINGLSDCKLCDDVAGNLMRNLILSSCVKHGLGLMTNLSLMDIATSIILEDFVIKMLNVTVAGLVYLSERV